MSSVYTPRRILCVPDNACSFTMISTGMDVISLESEKLDNSVSSSMSENVAVRLPFTLTSIDSPIESIGAY